MFADLIGGVTGDGKLPYVCFPCKSKTRQISWIPVYNADEDQGNNAISFL